MDQIKDIVEMLKDTGNGQSSRRYHEHEVRKRTLAFKKCLVRKGHSRQMVSNTVGVEVMTMINWEQSWRKTG